MIFVSAGFDAHERILAELRWDEHDFVWITKTLCGLPTDIHKEGWFLSWKGAMILLHWRGRCAHVKTLSGDKPQ